ncbi:hypothetical protein [Lactococcus allomyrinae]|uniref:Uncharacterized protein n=1 Tax=Lactococcus allomyrinae TaxID=2419773 RepID=A0A387BF12_9LACT|nr:hypothetical protein [Lactococcus allomyrinae]AYG01168.1 hypothetical protein D7I46_08695 [Lactococcus allomyrinae]
MKIVRAFRDPKPAGVWRVSYRPGEGNGPGFDLDLTEEELKSFNFEETIKDFELKKGIFTHQPSEKV